MLIAQKRMHLPAGLVILGLALLGPGCSREQAVDEVGAGSATAAKAGPVDRRSASYGIDEVIPASVPAGMGESLPVGEAAMPLAEEPGLQPDFLLPELELAAGDGRDHMGEGQRLFNDRRFLEAAAHLQVALEEKPEGWYAAYLLGLSLWKSGDLQGAESALRRAGEAHPAFSRTHVNLSRVLNEAGDYEAALAAADEALGHEPQSASAHYLRGRSLANLGRHLEAESALRQSLEQDEANGDVWNRLGLLLLRQERFSEALPALEEAAQQLPGRVYVHNNLGLVYERLGRFQDAADVYARGMALEDERGRLAANLDRVRAVLGLDPWTGKTEEAERVVAELQP